VVVRTVAALWLALTPALAAGHSVSGESDMAPSIHEVKAKYEKELMAKPGVVSVGIGQDADGKPVIIIGLEKAHADTMQSLPTELEGYRVRTEAIGPITAQ